MPELFVNVGGWNDMGRPAAGQREDPAAGQREETVSAHHVLDWRGRHDVHTEHDEIARVTDWSSS